MTLTPPLAAFPESTLRAVLAGCVGAWARSASRPATEGGGDAPRLLYVDAFAGAEMQFGTGVVRAGDEETRAAAAIRALGDADGGATVHALFVEEDPAHLQRIYTDLERVAGGERLRATRDFATLDPGEASLVEADFRNAAPEIARFAVGARALLLMAPPAARRLPWEVLRPFVASPDADVLIRFPHADFEKQSRHGGTLADLPGFARTIVEGASAMLDDAKHAWLPAWRTAARDGILAAMQDVLGRFARLLESAAPGRIVTPAALQSGGATTHLFLVTSDPALALAFSAATQSAAAPSPSSAARARSAPDAAPAAKSTKAKGGRSAKAAKPIEEPKAEESKSVEEPKPVEEPKAAEASRSVEEPKSVKKPKSEPKPVEEPAISAESPPEAAEAADEIAPEVESPAPEASPPAEASRPAPRPKPAAPAPALVLDLFPESLPTPAASEPAGVDVDALGESLAARHAGRAVPWGDLLRDLAAAGATADEAKRVLAALKRRGRAAYRALKDDADEVGFPRDPVAPAPAAPRKRKRAAEDAGFFGEQD